MASGSNSNGGKTVRFPQEQSENPNTDVFWLLLSNVPSGTIIGLDVNSWTVGPQFRGIRDIPFGVHYFFYNSASTEKNCNSVSGLRCSQFIYCNERRAIRKRWVKEREEFEDQPDGDVETILANKSEIDAYLGEYPRDRFANWIALSSCISVDTIERLQPSGRWIYSCSQFQSEKSNSKDRADLPIPLRLKRGEESGMDVVPPESISKGEELLPVLKSIPETDINWTPIPQHPLFPPGSNAVEISRHNIDQTYTLNHIIAHLEGESPEGDSPEPERRPTGVLSQGESRLLGEFHFAFVVFLLGEVLDGWFHWRKLLTLLANCEGAIKERPALYKALISSLYRLLVYNDETEGPETEKSIDHSVNIAGLFQAGGEDSLGSAFFDGWKECDPNEPAFLPHTIMRLFGNIAEAADSTDKKHRVNDVLDRAEGLRVCIESKFNVKLAVHRPDRTTDVGEISIDEVNWDTDEAPVIVLESNDI